MQPSCNEIVYSDAIGHSFGGYCVEIRHGVAYGAWSSEEACMKQCNWPGSYMLNILIHHI